MGQHRTCESTVKCGQPQPNKLGHPNYSGQAQFHSRDTTSQVSKGSKRVGRGVDGEQGDDADRREHDKGISPVQVEHAWEPWDHVQK